MFRYIYFWWFKVYCGSQVHHPTSTVHTVDRSAFLSKWETYKITNDKVTFTFVNTDHLTKLASCFLVTPNSCFKNWLSSALQSRSRTKSACSYKPKPENPPKDFSNNLDMRSRQKNVWIFYDRIKAPQQKNLSNSFGDGAWIHLSLPTSNVQTSKDNPPSWLTTFTWTYRSLALWCDISERNDVVILQV